MARTLAMFCIVSWLIPSPALAGDGRCKRGIASYYGRYHHGRQTANGERFNMRAATAASRTLRLGSRVLVRNLGNGREMELRINDRGPYVGGRLIDVSQGAAERLGFRHEGLARVTVCELR